MIDLHTHIIPGIDDGPPDLAGSLEFARAAQAAGTTTVVATPHVSWSWPNDSARIARALEKLDAGLAREGIDLEVVAGAELELSYAADLTDEELVALRLGGGDTLLLECPLAVMAPGFEELVAAIQARGHRVLLAHPERSPTVRRHPDILRSLVRGGALTSVTAGALLGQFGRDARRFAFWMLEEGLAHNVTSDAHDAVKRPPDLHEVLLDAADRWPPIGRQVDWLLWDVPRAILDGTPRPPAPPRSAPRRAKPARRGLFAIGGRRRAAG